MLRAPIISHLFFADDNLIFCKANTEASNSLLHLLDEYVQVSGQYINTDKTIMVFSENVKKEIRLRFVLCGVVER